MGLNARGWLLVYLLAVVTASFVHAPAILAAALACAVALAGKPRWRLLLRAVWAILTFNLTVSLGYALMAHWQGNFRADYLLLVNLRVVLLVYLGFWFASRVDLLAALRGWPTLELLATLALGQTRVFTRIVNDFRLAFESRNPARPHLADRVRNAAAQGQTLLDKSLASSTEVALAMRSRGSFDD